ncbi:MAG: AAA family ATPase [Trueperaceae bacterium]|nr:AAA family ATPase [Trueperaceae bacterium]
MDASISMIPIMANTFHRPYDELTEDEQRLVNDLVVKLHRGIYTPGQNLEKLGGAASNAHSMRVNDDVRLILSVQGQYAVLCYVGHHDDAYRWAESHRLEVNEDTGAAQFVVIDEKTVEVVKRKVVDQEPETPEERLSRRPFKHLADARLGQLGVPKAWRALVRDASEETFLGELGKQLPEEAREYLLEIAAGGTPKLPAKVAGRDPFDHPDARRRFRILNVDDDALRRALAEPWEDWEVFLHPAQQDAVDRSHSGPARVSGGPGTGKTVVAVHRAARLAREGRGKVLLTSFSKTLAERLQEQVNSLMRLEPEARARVDVVHLHQVAVRGYNDRSPRPFKALQSAGLDELLRRAWNEAGGGGQTLAFAEAEWDMVVDPHGLRDFASYRVTERATRVTPLGPPARERLWPVFDRLHELLDEEGLTTWSGVCWRFARMLDEAGERPYTHVVADEAQDLGPAELRLLRALAPEGENDVFIAGDGYQRIFKPRTSFLAAGLEVRGRSSVLRLNYRTTEEIRKAADALVARRAADDPEGEPGAVSLMTGPKPVYNVYPTVVKERAAVAEWIAKLVSTGYRPSEIAVLVRTKDLLDDRVKPALAAARCRYVELESAGTDEAQGVAIGTMHRSKGLQFRAVVVMGAEAGIVPLEKALRKQVDEPARRAFLEQERNLLYVACTRVRERLLVTGVGERSAFLGLV